MSSLLEQDVEKDSNIFQCVNIDDVASMTSSPPKNNPREIMVTFFFIDTIKRHIVTDIPNNVYAQHMVYSVMALIQTAMKEMDKACITILKRSLLYMNDAYISGQSYFKPPCVFMGVFLFKGISPPNILVTLW